MPSSTTLGAFWSKPPRHLESEDTQDGGRGRGPGGPLSEGGGMRMPGDDTKRAANDG